MVKILLFALLFLALNACGRIDRSGFGDCINVELPLDESIESYDIYSQSKEYHIVRLGKEGQSLLGNILDIESVNDSLVVWSGKNLLLYDSEGHYISTLGRYGRALDEYTEIGGVFVLQGQLFVCDNNAKKVLKYNLNNTVSEIVDYSRLNNPNNFQRIRPFEGSDLYIGLNLWNGTPDLQTPTFSLFDKKLNCVKTIDNRFRSDGMAYYDVFYPYNGEMLYWEFLNDTIFVVNKELEVKPKYYVDFGNKKLSSVFNRSSGDMSEKYEYILTNPAAVASRVSSVVENENGLYFLFKYNQKSYIGFFDKRSGNAKVYDMKISLEETNGFYFSGLFFINDSFVTVWFKEEDTDTETMLVFFKF